MMGFPNLELGEKKSNSNTHPSTIHRRQSFKASVRFKLKLILTVAEYW